MKKLILYAVLSLVSLNLICAIIDYTAIDFPEVHWSRIKCTNSLERLNQERRL